MSPRPFLLSLTLLLLLAGTAPAAAWEPSPFGINVHAPQGEHLERVLDRVQEAGIGWIRIDFIWALVEPQQDRFDWSVYDAIAAGARARGIEVFATLAYTPAWATRGPAITGVPADPEDWADFCTRAARRYRGSIRHWGLWNEPNLPRFWSGSRRQYIEVILERGADAVRAGNPDARVAGPELAHLTSGESDWYDWLREVIVQAGDRLDVVTHHVYDGDGHRDVTERLEDDTIFGDRPDLWDAVTPSVQEVLLEAGWFGRPFWLTETGWATDRVSESRQADYYRGLLGDWLTGRPRRDWVHKIFFYELQDDPNPGIPDWGILRTDDRPKPAFGACRDFIAANQVEVEDARLVALRIPDRMEAGQTVEARVTLRNVGNTTWTRGAGFKLGAVGDDDPFAELRHLLAADQEVPPGEEATFVVPMRAPGIPGVFRTDWQMVREGVNWFGDLVTKTVTVDPGPPGRERTLELVGGRYRVAVSWFDHGGRAGVGRAAGHSDATGFFWFFDRANVELIVKVLDGGAINGHVWVFYGGLSDVEYWIDVTDTATGEARRYYNPPGNLCGGADTAAFASTGAPLPGAINALAEPLVALPELAELPDLSWLAAPAGAPRCTPGARTLCLFGERFQVTVRWRTRAGATGFGNAVPRTGQTGTFWFFAPDNLELVVKVIDGRPLNDRFWVFWGALSDVEYWINVTDLETGVRKRYHNPPGNLCGGADTAAF